MSRTGKYTALQRAEVESALRGAVTLDEYRRVQAVWLHMLFGLGAAETGMALGLHEASVWRIRARYHREGAAMFRAAAKGGRRNANMDIFEEKKMMQPFLHRMRHEGWFEVSDVRRVYEAAIGRSVPDSAVYRLLKRHGLNAPRCRRVG